MRRVPVLPSRRAAAVVEFAVIAPMLTFLGLGLMELSRGLMVKQVMSDAARAAARKAVLPGATVKTVSQVVTDILSNNKLPTTGNPIVIKLNDVAVTSLADAKTYDKVTVEVSVTAKSIAWVSSLFIPSNSTISSTAHMMHH